VNGTLDRPSAPVVDPRTADDVAADVERRAPAYTPTWRLGRSGPGAAATAAFGRFMRALIERVNRAPDKHELAFLDLLGVDLLPAHAARAPLVFTPLPGVGDSQVPAGTRAAAKIVGGQVVFETESPIGLAGARLAEVVTVWPGRDQYADHSAALAGGLPTTLWSGMIAVDHELYLAHDVHFALAGKCSVLIDFRLERNGSEPLALAWQYWDGSMWRDFKSFENDATDPSKSFDGTAGLTRTGVVRLAADCCESEQLVVNGVKAFWLRAQLTTPLPPMMGRTLPTIDRIFVRSMIDRRVVGATGLPPDAAFANGSKLDVSKTFQPLGSAATPGSVMTLKHEEAFSKPGATVTIAMVRSKTPAERGDDLTAAYQLDVNAAKTLMDSLILKLQTDIIPALVAIRDGVLTGVAGLTWALIIDPIKAAFTALSDQQTNWTLDWFKGLWNLTQAVYETTIGPIVDLIAGFVGAGGNAGGIFDSIKDAFATAFNVVAAQVNNLTALVNSLLTFTPESAAVALGAKQPVMMAPAVAWEYWDGSAWRDLSPTFTGAGALTFESAPATTVTLTFTVPPDWEPMTLDGVTGRFMRARLASGGYGVLRTTSWKDQVTQLIDFLPIIENRPPSLDSLTLGYLYQSPGVPPDRCVTHGDFAWIDRSIDVASPGNPFEPFAPVADTAPTLYLGFDGPLPADTIGVWFDFAQTDAQASGPSVRWEYADGNSWIPLSVEDETDGLVQPGITRINYPGVAEIPTTLVIAAADSTVQLRYERTASSRFNPGDVIWIENDGKGELATVRDRADDMLTLVTPLAKSYARGTASRARLARFGNPRAWLRARLAEPVDPPIMPVGAITPNAVWASQRQTSSNELLGSSNGQASQVFFTRDTPVLPGEIVEIRELEGARANVEYELLRRELLDAGGTDADLRVVRNPRTLQISEVWTRWRPQRTLLFSGPTDRHFAVERTRGRVLFGDDLHGRIPPSGTDNVRIVRYASGGGVIGNVPLGAISQLMSGVAAQKIMNARAAEGGADGERAEDVLWRGPRTVRHRRQAISQLDYEALAREASPAVALVRAQPSTDASGRRTPGAVTLFVVPQSTEPRPMPALSLLRDVRQFLLARMPVGARAGLVVEPPRYQLVGVEASIAVLAGREAGAVREAVIRALAAFLHPLTGGPGGSGWPFGRDVFLSDIAAMLEETDGVDYVQTLMLVSNGNAQGDSVAVPLDRLVAAGDLRVTLAPGVG
jgi:hypothetical protein